MKNIRNLIISVILLAGMTSFSVVAQVSAFNFNSFNGFNFNINFPNMLSGGHKWVCGTSNSAVTADCLSQVVTDRSGNPAAATLPAGYGPLQFHTAYQIPSTSSNPGVIGIVDAYGDSTISSDLATYDKTYGLSSFPTCSTSVKTACFEKISQTGSTTRFPGNNSGWALETSLDVEVAHQTCQNCKLVLVEANNSSYSNLMAAVDEAHSLGATVISNSYGSSEFNGETSYDSHFNYTGTAIIFAAGDSSYGPIYPAASPHVVSVGGTTLNLSSSNAWQSETVWNGTGSGCSVYEPRPTFQSDSACTNRTIADVSADADPNTGAAVYDSVGYYWSRGWFQVGGTSLATPLIAGIYALANNVGSSVYANSVPYSAVSYGVNMHDITTGSNGSCNGTNLCQASAGYDGPSGLGSPIGLGAF
ncbi:MAG TPA: S53 family peptidase [Candidatus Saccharimonadales bacterium]|nr:S53 family peptidase [Candidatus Saccharimonadales bacterium]